MGESPPPNWVLRTAGSQACVHQGKKSRLFRVGKMWYDARHTQHIYEATESVQEGRG